jgi:hypothetical protein
MLVDRVTLIARLQVQRRGTFVAELSTSWIAVVAEGAHPVAKIRGARGEGPVRGAWRAHAGILSCRNDLASGLGESAPSLPGSPSVARRRVNRPSEISFRLRFSTRQNQGERLLPDNFGRAADRLVLAI